MNLKSTLLVVDDDPINLEILKAILDDKYNLICAASGEQALEVFNTQKPDLVLLDIIMPGIDGFEVCKRIKSDPEITDTLVLFLSSSSSTNDIVKGFSLGGADYITKPIRAEEVIARVKTHLALQNALNTINLHNQQLEKLLEERTQELIHTERQAAFSLLLKGIVHNLRSPLSLVQGNLDLLEIQTEKLAKEENTKTKLPTEERQNILQKTIKFSKKIGIGAERLNKMINLMLAKSRSDKIDQLETINLNELLEQELLFLNADYSFKNKISPDVQLCKESLIINIVPSEIAQVFQNLIKNAIDAMVEQETGQQMKIAISSGRYRKFLWFSVADNGPGIKGSDLKRIFEPFYTTKHNQNPATSGGTGLGLHFSLETVRSYGGNIKVDTCKDKGTTFTVQIPGE
jgi:signal transduction histidine kinase